MQVKQVLRALCLARTAEVDTMNQPHSQPNESLNIPPHYDGYHVVEHRMTHTVQTMEPDDERRWRMREKLIQQREQIMYQQQQHEQRQAGPNYPNSQLQVQNNAPAQYSNNCSNNNSNYPPAYGYPASLPPQFTVSQSAPGAVTQTVAPAQLYGYRNNYSHTQSFDPSQVPPNVSLGVPNQKPSSGADGFHVQQQQIVLYQNGNYPSQISQPKTCNANPPEPAENRRSILISILAGKSPKTPSTPSNAVALHDSLSARSVPQNELAGRSQGTATQYKAATQNYNPVNWSQRGVLEQSSTNIASNCSTSATVPSQAISHIRAIQHPQSSQPTSQYNSMIKDVVSVPQNRPVHKWPRQQFFGNQVSSQRHVPVIQSYGSKPADAHQYPKTSDAVLNCDAPNQANSHIRITHGLPNPPQSSSVSQPSSVYNPRQQDFIRPEQNRPIQAVPRQQSFSSQVSTVQSQGPTSHGYGSNPVNVHPRVNLSETALISGVPAAPNQAKSRNQVLHEPGHSLQSSQPAAQSSSAYGSRKQDISSVSQSRSLQEVPTQQSFVQVLPNQDQAPTGHTHVRRDLDMSPSSKVSVIIDHMVDTLVARYPSYFVDPDFIKKFEDYAKMYKPKEASGHT